MLELEPVPVTVVLDGRSVALFVPDTIRLGTAGVVRVDEEVRKKGERTIDAEYLIGLAAVQRGRSMGCDDTDGASAKNVTLESAYREVRGIHPQRSIFVGVNVQGTDGVWPGAAGHPAPEPDRDRPAFDQADAPTEEDDGRIADRCETGEPWPCAAEPEDVAAFEKKLSLFGKEKVETGQVHLRLVHFDLCEIGVVGEVGDETSSQPVGSFETGGEATVSVVTSEIT